MSKHKGQNIFCKIIMQNNTLLVKHTGPIRGAKLSLLHKLIFISVIFSEIFPLELCGRSSEIFHQFSIWSQQRRDKFWKLRLKLPLKNCIRQWMCGKWVTVWNITASLSPNHGERWCLYNSCKDSYWNKALVGQDVIFSMEKSPADLLVSSHTQVSAALTTNNGFGNLCKAAETCVPSATMWEVQFK